MIATTALLLTPLMASGACAANKPATQTQQIAEAAPAAQMADFEIIAGPGWTGTLSYLDYTSEARESIPVTVSIDGPSKRSLSYAIKYPGESQYNARETIRLSRGGRRLNGEIVVSRTKNEDGSLEIVTQKPGKDNGQKAMIERRYVLSASKFTIRKNVKFSGAPDFFNRNEFSLTR